jgi:hypothetical protein
MKAKKLLTLPPYLRVIKTKMMWPFCVGRQINIHLHTLVTFVKIDARNVFMTPGCSHYVWQLKMHSIATRLETKIFLLLYIRDQNFLVAIHVAIENYQLPILRHLKVFITNLVVIEDFPWPMVW